MSRRALPHLAVLSTLLFVTSLTLLGCGGGGGGGTPAPAPAPVVAPAPVQPLSIAFNDPPQPGAAAVSSEYGGVRPDGSAGNAFMLLDASGRFVLTNRTSDFILGSYTSTSYGEDVFLGTATITGTSFTASSVTFLHRDAGTTDFRPGSPVAINGVVGTTSGGANSLQLSITGAAVQPIDTMVTLNSVHLGYVRAPYTVPVWEMNNGALTATADGRVRGTLAADCTIDAAISVTDPTHNVYRMQAVLAGSGCAAVGLVPGTGEFLGDRFMGPIHAYGPPVIYFVGVVGNTAVRLDLYDPAY